MKKRVFEIIQIGSKKDIPSTIFDLFITAVIFLNLSATVFATFEESIPYKSLLSGIELVTCIIFVAEYILRIWTAEFLYPKENKYKAVIKFAGSFYGIVDLLTFLPVFLPFFFPSGMGAFRIFRVIRIFRLFKINARYDAYNVIVEVLTEKKNQIISSVSMILIFMLAASMCMYSLEHDAQPEAFKNAFSGVWWSVSTLLTVGYGDIYPITPLGKLMAIVISFLGVGMVAIPTGIISAGFVEHYTKIRMMALHSEEKELKFVTSVIPEDHPWNHKTVKEIVLPPQLLLVMIIRQGETLLPSGNTEIFAGDTMVIGAKNYTGQREMHLKEVKIKEEHDWVGQKIRDLDMSRQELIVMIRRKNKTLIPNGSTTIREDDTLVIYSRLKESE